MAFSDIIQRIEKAIKALDRTIPGTQRLIYDSLTDELKRLDTTNGKIKATVRNLAVINSINNKLSRLVLNDEYLKDVKEYAKAFNDVTKLQNEYWKSIEAKFKPRPLLKAIRKQTISETVKALAGAGIGEGIGTQIADILRTNITTGGSYAALTEQLRESLLKTETPGILDKYIKQIASDSITQYSRQYTQIVSADLGLTWFSYRNSDIMTTRPWCDAMTDRRYFHYSSMPMLLKGKNEDGTSLRYNDKKTGELKTVTIYEKTGLPHGMIPGTDAANLMIRAGGYNCRHIIQNVSETLVKRQAPDLYQKIINSAPYKAWQAANS